jgi:hypothetical protein
MLAKIQMKQFFMTPSVLSVSSVVKSAFSPKGREFFAEEVGCVTPFGNKIAVRRENPRQSYLGDDDIAGAFDDFSDE